MKGLSLSRSDLGSSRAFSKKHKNYKIIVIKKISKCFSDMFIYAGVLISFECIIG